MMSDWQTNRMASPGELALMLTYLGMSQSGCGRFLGHNDRTVRRYLRGESNIPAAEVMLLRACIHYRVKPRVPPRNPRLLT